MIEIEAYSKLPHKELAQRLYEVERDDIENRTKIVQLNDTVATLIQRLLTVDQENFHLSTRNEKLARNERGWLGRILFALGRRKEEEFAKVIETRFRNWYKNHRDVEDQCEMWYIVNLLGDLTQWAGRPHEWVVGS